MLNYHPDISIIVPVYKEQGNIEPFVRRVEAMFVGSTTTYELIFALDPSPDQTQQVIERCIEKNPNIRLLKMSRRFGQSAATIAGLMTCGGATAVAIDVDLQDPPELIIEMHRKLSDGYDVVYATRRSRKGETLLKRFIAYTGYAVINRLSDLDIPRNTGDYRIMTRRVLEELRKFEEKPGYWRGLISYIGFRQASVEFDREERNTGRGNYNRLTGSISGGLNGVIGFSSRPLQMMSFAGLLIAILSFALGLWFVVAWLAGIQVPTGLTTLAILIAFSSGVQLLGLGLLGEYVGRTYDEAKRRPPYIIDERVNFSSERSEADVKRG